MDHEAPLTVSELAAIVVDPALGDNADTVLRQLRYWSVIGLLEPADGLFVGRGRHRRYDPDEIYRAAILVRFAALGLAAAALAALNKVFDEISARGVINLDTAMGMSQAELTKYRRREFLWGVEHSLPRYLAFSFVLNPRADAVEQTHYWIGTWDSPVTGSGEPTLFAAHPETWGYGLPPSFAAGGAAAIVINLTELFRRVSARAGR